MTFQVNSFWCTDNEYVHESRRCWAVAQLKEGGSGRRTEPSEGRVADPGTEVRTYKWVKPVLFKVRLLSCFIVDFILRICTLILSSWRPRKVSSIMLYCFCYEPQHCVFFATNEPVNFMTSTMQGQAASRNFATGQNFLFWSLHSWKSNSCQNKKHGDSKAGYLQRVSYSKSAWLEEITIYIASVFKVLQSCSARWFARKFYVTDNSSSAMSSCHKTLAVVRTSS